MGQKRKARASFLSVASGHCWSKPILTESGGFPGHLGGVGIQAAIKYTPTPAWGHSLAVWKGVSFSSYFIQALEGSQFSGGLPSDLPSGRREG